MQHALLLLESDNASRLATHQIFFEVQDALSVLGSDKLSRLADRQRIFESQHAPNFFWNPTKHLVRQHVKAFSRDSTPQVLWNPTNYLVWQTERNILFASFRVFGYSFIGPGLLVFLEFTFKRVRGKKRKQRKRIT